LGFAGCGLGFAGCGLVSAGACDDGAGEFGCGLVFAGAPPPLVCGADGDGDAGALLGGAAFCCCGAVA
jgi:hypothetical protein